MQATLTDSNGKIVGTATVDSGIFPRLLIVDDPSASEDKDRYFVLRTGQMGNLGFYDELPYTMHEFATLIPPKPPV